MNTARKPKGAPAGGQHKARSNPEGGLNLAPATWPAIEYEERSWEPDHEDNIWGSKSQRHKERGPYQAAVTPPIAEIPAVELPPEVEVLANEASIAIARFDAEVGAEIAPFSAILLRSESAASSEIENLTAGAKAIAMAELGDRSRRNAVQVVANTTAMRSAIALADNLDKATIIAMHTALLQDEHPEWTGDWRNEQVRIGGQTVHTATFVPPHHDRVPVAMDDLVRFVARDDLAPFVQAAVAHAQFETIHPFPDGNGRVGRALIHAILRNKGLTENVTVPVSAGLLVNVDDYFKALNEYRAGDPAPIVRHLAEASFEAIDNGRHLVADIRNVSRGWKEKITARSDAKAWPLSELLLRQPAIDSTVVQEELGIRQQVADRAIETLVDAGVLTKVSGNHRSRKWAAVEILDTLDEFAKRTGRRKAH